MKSSNESRPFVVMACREAFRGLVHTSVVSTI